MIVWITFALAIAGCTIGCCGIATIPRTMPLSYWCARFNVAVSAAAATLEISNLLR